IPTVAALDQAFWNASGAGVSSMSTVGAQMTTSFMTLLLNPFVGSPDSNPAALGYARNFGAAGSQRSREAEAAYAAVTPKDPRVAATFDQRWSMWGQAYGGSNRTAADPSGPGADLSARTYGLAAGFDYRVSPDTMLGFALGGGGTSFGLSNGLSGRSDAL